MTVKQFFKSTSFKCIAALLCILLLCGVFLTIAYGFLEVTAGERLQRAIQKMYDGSLTVTIYGAGGKEITAQDEDPQGFLESPVTYGNAVIQQAYKVTFNEKEEFDYLVSSQGKDGYGGGTVTCWVAVEVNAGGIIGLGSVSVSSNSGQSFIGKITNEFLASFSSGYQGDDTYYATNDGYLSSGATRSSNAICNAVNGAIAYVNAEFFGNTATDIFEGCVYTELIDTTNPSTDYSVNGTEVSYSIVTTSYKGPGPFTINVKVGAGGIITRYEIITNGSTADKYLNAMPDDVKDGTRFIGKTLSFFTGVYGEDMAYTTNNPEITTGATASQSIYLCYYAGAFATANYETCLANPKEGGDAE